MPRKPRPWAEIVPCLTPKVLQRFRKRVPCGPSDACWPWTGGTNQYGYGMLAVPNGESPIVATRIAFWLANNLMDDEKFVCHTCDNPPCCNPKHLWLGTHAENLSDRNKKGRYVAWNKGLKLGPRKRAA